MQLHRCVIILLRQVSQQLITLVPAILYPCHIPFKNSSFNVSHWNRSPDIRFKPGQATKL